MTILVSKTDVSTVCRFYAILKQFDFCLCLETKIPFNSLICWQRGSDIVTAPELSLGTSLRWGCSLIMGNRVRRATNRELFKRHGEGKGKSYCVFPISHESLQRTSDTATDVCRDSRTESFGVKAFLPYKSFLQATSAS